AATGAVATTTKRLRRTSRRARLLHTAVYLTTLALLATGWWLVLGGEGRPSLLARILGTPDTRVHVWLGWGMAVALALPILVWWRGVLAFVRETFRFDRGDGRWWLRWPGAVLTGRFARHQGHFDPGQRAANVVLVGGLLVLTATGIGMTLLHGGPLFAWLAGIHRWTTFAITPIIAGHLLVAIGVLPGYRGVWRAMHIGGRVSEDAARRLWPAWAERSVAASDE
ncbi:MAG: cytochrome b/b6 domain-containing protein, partial [Actinomycetota bacterium]